MEPGSVGVVGIRTGLGVAAGFRSTGGWPWIWDRDVGCGCSAENEFSGC